MFVETGPNVTVTILKRLIHERVNQCFMDSFRVHCPEDLVIRTQNNSFTVDASSTILSGTVVHAEYVSRPNYRSASPVYSDASSSCSVSSDDDEDVPYFDTEPSEVEVSPLHFTFTFTFTFLFISINDDAFLFFSV